MPAHDPSANNPEGKRQFLLQLPQRLMRLRQRGERLCEAGWDINVLRMLAEDAATIAGVCRDLDASALADELDALHETTAALLDPARLPDRATAAHVAGLLNKLSSDRLPDALHTFGDAASVVVAGPVRDAGFPLLVAPPAGYWMRFAGECLRASKAASDSSPLALDAVAETSATPVRDLTDVADRRSSDRRAYARGAIDGETTDSLERLLQRAGDHSVAISGVAPAGALLLFMADDTVAHNAAGHPAFSNDIRRFLATLAGADATVAADEQGHLLLFDPARDAGLLEAYALCVRERMAREPLGDPGVPRHALFDVGICPFFLGARDIQAMRDAARNAIDNGRAANRHGVFVVRDLSVVDDVSAAAEAELVERIRFALDATGFEVLFQPIVPLQGDDDEQFQALLRLRDDEHTLLVAADIIPAAERAGLIESVDRWVLEHCIATAGRRSEGKRCQRLFVSQSLGSMRDANAPVWLRETLTRHGVDASTIVLELRAVDASRALDEAGRYALAMQALGSDLALSGFDVARDAHLLELLRPGFVKIEPQILQADLNAARDELRALVDALHAHGARVIAPRVEDARGAATLWSAGVDFIQGNFVQAADSEMAFDFGESVM